jgi:TPR repeat protein
VGSPYLLGEGVARDPAEAVRWLRRAAEQDMAPAQFDLGVCYRDGDGLTKDPGQAAAWLRKAEGGHPSWTAAGRVSQQRKAVGTIARCAEATCVAPGPSPTAAHRAAGLRFTWPAYPHACAAVHPWTLA